VFCPGEAASGEKTEKVKHGEGEEDDDEDWDAFKMESKKENSLETKRKESHSVHCPFFPAVSCWSLLSWRCLNISNHALQITPSENMMHPNYTFA
jgi:hypothetical protein